MHKALPAQTGLMLDQHRRHQPNIKSALGRILASIRVVSRENLDKFLSEQPGHFSMVSEVNVDENNDELRYISLTTTQVPLKM